VVTTGLYDLLSLDDDWRGIRLPGHHTPIFHTRSQK